MQEAGHMIRTTTISSAMLGVGMILSGCAGSRGASSELAPLPAALSGSYDVYGNIHNDAVNAIVTFYDDRTYRIDSNYGSCSSRFSNLVRGPKISLGCSNLRITFSIAGREFFNHADASLTTRETVPSGQVCKRYETDPTTGRRVCVEEEIRYVERTVTRTGSLQVRRAQ
jgi:hypothetical protein